MKTTSVWLGLTLVAVFLTAALAYRAYVRDEGPPVADVVLAPTATSTAREESGVNPESAAGVGAGEFRERLLTMPEPIRNQIFWLTLRDARLQCDEVQSSGHLGAGAWFARCGETSAYEVAVDEFGRLSASPLPYGDFQFGIRGGQDMPLIQPR